MTRGLLERARALLCALCLWVASPARAASDDRVRVDVIDISGGRAYLSAGSAQGLGVGSRVRFRNVEHRVEQASRHFAVVPARRLRVGDSGVAFAASSGKGSVRSSRPRPHTAFAGQWPESVPPARTQRPRRVPLGPMVAATTHGTASLAASGLALAPLEGERDPVGRAELRARLQATPFAGSPIFVNGDVALQQWFGRYASGTAADDPRPWLRVRELALTFGEVGGYRAQLGRLRYAAENLGPLDGGRFEIARQGALQIAGFGGLLPGPIDGRFAHDAGRFGVELRARGAGRGARPELTLVAQGSVFEGRLDERRAYARAQLWPGRHRLGAYAEGALFDADNPWRRPRADLTAAGADFELRFASGRLGGRFDMRKPERSYWLQSYLPLTWLCASSSLADPAARCAGTDDTRYVAHAYGGLDLRRIRLDGGGSWASSSQRELGQHVLGYATLRVPDAGGRYELALGGTHEAGSFVRASSALRGDLTLSWLEQRLRMNVYYRPAHRRYRASESAFWEHGTGIGIYALVTRRLSFDLLTDLRVGDVNALLTLLNLTYRMDL
jgi:hypothetical protein